MLKHIVGLCSAIWAHYTDDSGDALQNLLQVFIYGLGAAAIITGVIVAVGRFGNRTEAGLDAIQPATLP